MSGTQNQLLVFGQRSKTLPWAFSLQPAEENFGALDCCRWKVRVLRSLAYTIKSPSLIISMLTAFFIIVSCAVLALSVVSVCKMFR